MTNNGKKRGKLALEEMKFIRENCHDMPLEEIAARINRTVDPVKRFIALENLKSRDLTDDEHLLSTLRTRHYYVELQKQLTESELEFFEHQWIDYYKQFGEDVTHTEEMQIIEVIRTEILINRSMEDRQTILREIARTESLIDAEMSKSDENRNVEMIGVWGQQLGSLIGSKGSYINEHEKLLTKKERYLKDLKGTREQRKKIAEDSKTSFPLWLRALDTPEMKEREGFDLAMQALAADKERLRLAQYHEYEDGQVDQPLFNSQTAIEENGES